MNDAIAVKRVEAGAMSTELMGCIPKAVTETCNSLCDLSLDMCDGLIEDIYEPGISSFISLSGDVNWTIFVSIPQDTARQIVADFVGFEIPFESEDMADAVGEFANILAGQVKSLLDSERQNVEQGLPEVTRLDNVSDFVQKNKVLSNYCFDSMSGRIWAGLVDKAA